ncbi:hypothetical protein ABZ746_30530 [Streptomyces sp. NPDC020096]
MTHAVRFGFYTFSLKGRAAPYSFGLLPTPRTSFIPFPAQRIQRHDTLGGLIHEYRSA